MPNRRRSSFNPALSQRATCIKWPVLAALLVAAAVVVWTYVRVVGNDDPTGVATAVMSSRSLRTEAAKTESAAVGTQPIATPVATVATSIAEGYPANTCSSTTTTDRSLTEVNNDRRVFHGTFAPTASAATASARPARAAAPFAVHARAFRTRSTGSPRWKTGLTRRTTEGCSGRRRCRLIRMPTGATCCSSSLLARRRLLPLPPFLLTNSQQQWRQPLFRRLLRLRSTGGGGATTAAFEAATTTTRSRSRSVAAVYRRAPASLFVRRRGVQQGAVGRVERGHSSAGLRGVAGRGTPPARGAEHRLPRRQARGRADGRQPRRVVSHRGAATAGGAGSEPAPTPRDPARRQARQPRVQRLEPHHPRGPVRPYWLILNFDVAFPRERFGRSTPTRRRSSPRTSASA